MIHLPDYAYNGQIKILPPSLAPVPTYLCCLASIFPQIKHSRRRGRRGVAPGKLRAYLALGILDKSA